MLGKREQFTTEQHNIMKNPKDALEHAKKQIREESKFKPKKAAAKKKTANTKIKSDNENSDKKVEITLKWVSKFEFLKFNGQYYKLALELIDFALVGKDCENEKLLVKKFVVQFKYGCYLLKENNTHFNEGLTLCFDAVEAAVGLYIEKKMFSIKAPLLNELAGLPEVLLDTKEYSPDVLLWSDTLIPKLEKLVKLFEQHDIENLKDEKNQNVYARMLQLLAGMNNTAAQILSDKVDNPASSKYFLACLNYYEAELAYHADGSPLLFRNRMEMASSLAFYANTLFFQGHLSDAKEKITYARSIYSNLQQTLARKYSSLNDKSLDRKKATELEVFQGYFSEVLAEDFRSLPNTITSIENVIFGKVNRNLDAAMSALAKIEKSVNSILDPECHLTIADLKEIMIVCDSIKVSFQPQNEEENNTFNETFYTLLTKLSFYCEPLNIFLERLKNSYQFVRPEKKENMSYFISALQAHYECEQDVLDKLIKSRMSLSIYNENVYVFIVDCLYFKEKIKREGMSIAEMDASITRLFNDINYLSLCGINKMIYAKLFFELTSAYEHVHGYCNSQLAASPIPNKSEVIQYYQTKLLSLNCTKMMLEKLDADVCSRSFTLYPMKDIYEKSVNSLITEVEDTLYVQTENKQAKKEESRTIINELLAAEDREQKLRVEMTAHHHESQMRREQPKPHNDTLPKPMSRPARVGLFTSAHTKPIRTYQFSSEFDGKKSAIEEVFSNADDLIHSSTKLGKQDYKEKFEIYSQAIALIKIALQKVRELHPRNSSEKAICIQFLDYCDVSLKIYDNSINSLMDTAMAVTTYLNNRKEWLKSLGCYGNNVNNTQKTKSKETLTVEAAESILGQRRVITAKLQEVVEQSNDLKVEIIKVEFEERSASELTY